MRVLLLASDCNPEWPSLPIVTYKAARALGRCADVTLATHVRNRENIEKHGFPEGEIVYLDNEYVGKPLDKISRWLRGGEAISWSMHVAARYPSQVAFEHEAWRLFGDEIRRGRFDVVHRISPMSPALPSPMAKWCPVPFVLGPINGGLEWPPEFQAEFKREREHVRKLRGLYKMLPYSRSTFRDSAAILASFSHTIADLHGARPESVIDFPEVGADPDLFRFEERDVSKGPLTFVSVGRFVALKLYDVVIRAFAASEELRRHKLVLVGDGVERPHLEELIAEHDLGDVVHITGWVGQQEVGRQVRNADVFVFPSIRELGAGVVVEAMACGTVPVVVDYGGPGGLVDATTGTKVDLAEKDVLVQRYTAALERYAEDRELLARQARAAHEHVMRHFTWDKKAEKTVEIYEWVVGRRADKPRFGASR